MDNRIAPQQLYYDQGTPGYMPTRPSGYGYQQQFYPGRGWVIVEVETANMCTRTRCNNVTLTNDLEIISSDLLVHCLTHLP
ncbi:hypothetical protein SESBI_10031 [Sesbania bispinosa]|nr:hypothetical protein SESBI_10031 [Sesbania bispinosa]